ncbi:restriction endonuclease subunit S [Ramlibacter tataouinensis]|uniref:restriction endonuclease subunit S n=1 Tax=Ramlibacter tataouinensis TaxID=94132 RepID=UPI0002D5D23D|nr:restriction endonuclease subunit S [Ramlibacter tataouinensis]
MADAQPALVRQFEMLATAPGGVARLRDLILRLAVQGKLVQQREHDNPVAVLLREAEPAKEGAAFRSRFKATKTDDELIAPFALPESWAWVRLGEVTDISGGVTLGRKGTVEQPITLPYLRVANVQRWNVLCQDLKTVTIAKTELDRYQLRAGDLLITEGGDWDKVGRTAIWSGELPICLHQNHVFKARGLTPSWNSEWAQVYLNSPVARAYFASCSKQTTNLASINMTQLKACAFPLPPVAEQARIVARVDELMRLCDALEAQGRLEAEQHARLLGTLLGTLTDSSTPEELAANWKRVADHFDLLLDRPEAVDALEQTVLQLAVRGLLVPQDPRDEPASELLKAIREEKSRWSNERRGRREAPESRTDRLGVPFAAPPGWSWVGPDQVALQITDGTHHTPKYQARGVAFISVKDINGSTVNFSDCKYIAEDEHREINARCNPERGDLLLCRIGTLGRATLVDTDRPFSLFVSVGLIKLPKSKDIGRYLHMVLSSPLLAEQYQSIKAGGSHTNKLNLGDIPRLQIPLPPLAEQARIVARVTELRRLCTNLRQRLNLSKATQTALADALVDPALAA